MINLKKKKNIIGNLNTKIKKNKNAINEKLHTDECPETLLFKKDHHRNSMEMDLKAALLTLLQADINTAEIYKNVLENIQNDENIYYELNSIRNDHLRHIANLTKLIPSFHAKRIETKGDVWSDYVKLLGNIMSVDSFLNTLLSCEKKLYQLHRNLENINSNLDKSLKQILFDNFEDEKSHIKYIEEQLSKLDK